MTVILGGLPSGKQPHNYGKSPFFMGKSTIFMAIFNSYVKLPEGIHSWQEFFRAKMASPQMLLAGTWSAMERQCLHAKEPKNGSWLWVCWMSFTLPNSEAGGNPWVEISRSAGELSGTLRRMVCKKFCFGVHAKVVQREREREMLPEFSEGFWLLSFSVYFHFKSSDRLQKKLSGVTTMTTSLQRKTRFHPDVPSSWLEPHIDQADFDLHQATWSRITHASAPVRKQGNGKRLLDCFKRSWNICRQILQGRGDLWWVMNDSWWFMILWWFYSCVKKTYSVILAAGKLVLFRLQGGFLLCPKAARNV